MLPLHPPAGPWDRLTESELTQYYSIMNDWQEIWLRALKLRDQVNARRKLSDSIIDSDYENGENASI